AIARGGGAIVAVVAEVRDDKGEAREPTAVEIGGQGTGRGATQRHIISQAGGVVAAPVVVRRGVVFHGVRPLRCTGAVGRHVLDIAAFRSTGRPDLPEEIVGGDRVGRRVGVVGDAIGLSGSGAEVVGKGRASDLVVVAVRAAPSGQRCLVRGSGVPDDVAIGAVLHPDPHHV